MFKNQWKKVSLVFGILFTFVIAGCGDIGASNNSNDNKSENNVSKELNYTITGIEPGAGQTQKNDEVIAGYENLKGWKQELSSTGAMLSALDEAIKNEEPIIFTAWSPHYKFAKWDLKFLEDPKGLFGDEESGVTLARKGLKEDFPVAYEILDRIHWEVKDLETALLKAEDEDIETVANRWVEENEEIVAEWTEGIAPANGDSIEIVMTPWEDSTFRSHVAGIVLEQHGFNVTLTPVDPAVVFKSIATGNADATLAPWLPSTHRDMYEAYEGDFEDLGPNFSGAKIGLAVPSYMKIDSLEDLEPKK